MQNIQIPIHSFVDIITNSSTEIYVSAHGKTVAMVEKLVDSILQLAGSSLRCSSLFTVKVVYKVYTKSGTKRLTEEEIKKLIEAGEIDESEDPTITENGWGEPIYRDSYVSVELKPDVNSNEAAEAARAIESIRDMFDTFVRENR